MASPIEVHHPDAGYVEIHHYDYYISAVMVDVIYKIREKAETYVFAAGAKKNTNFNVS